MIDSTSDIRVVWFVLVDVRRRVSRGVDRGGVLWGAEAPPRETWDGGPRQGCRQGNRGFVVRWWVACGKNVKSY
jgi:hypothetical protein